jgi:hypothetical protein
MVDEVKTNDGIEIRCDIDGTTLWFRYNNGIEEPRCSCSHFYWMVLGNGCYPIKIDEDVCANTDWIPRNAVKVIQNGSTYFLLPNLRHYD